MLEPNITYKKAPKYIPEDILNQVFEVLNQQRQKGIETASLNVVLDAEYRMAYYEACKHIKQ